MPYTVSGGQRGGYTGGRPVGGVRSTAGRTSARPVPSAAQRGYQGWAQRFAQQTGRTPEQAANLHVGPGPAFSPIRWGLDQVSRPSYAIGNLIAGRPLDSLRQLASGATLGLSNLVPGMDAPDTMPSQALRERGLLPGGALGAAIGLPIDVVTDPYTYLTLGSSSVGKALAREAAEQGIARVAQAATRAERLQEIGRLTHAVETARRSVPRAISVNLRVPLSRAREVPVANLRAPVAAAERVGTAVGETRLGRRIGEVADRGRQAFTRTGGTDAVTHETGQAIRRAAEAEKRRVSQMAVGFQREVERAAKAAKMDPAEALRSISRHLDNPERHAVPEALAPLAERARSTFGDWHQELRDFGIDLEGVPNYAPHLAATPRERRKFERMFPASRDNPFYMRQRELQNFDQWEAIGLRPELNIARLLEVRGHAQVDAIAKKARDDVVAEAVGVTKPAKVRQAVGAQLRLVDEVPAAPAARTGAREATPEEWATAASRWQELGSRYHEGVKVPPKVAEAVRRLDAQVAQTGTPEGLRAVTDFVKRTTSRWKALALLSPGYHSRNMQSDLLTAWWFGARNPVSFVQAGRALAGKGSVKVGKRTLSAEELIREAESLGVVHTGQGAAEIARDMGDLRTGLHAVRAPGRGRLSQASMRLGQGREDMSRLGLYLERLRAGDDPVQAARTVREALFDYGDTSAFVQEARRFWLPFITWSSKMAPLVLKRMLTHPRDLAGVNRAMVAANEAAGNPDLSLLPAGARASVPIPFLGGRDTPYLWNPESVAPYGVLNSFDPQNVTRSLGNFLNPAIKAPIEVGTGWNFYFGRALPPSSRAKAPAAVVAAARLGVPVMGFGPKTDIYTGQTVPGYSRRLDAVLRTLPIFSQSASLIPGGGTETSRVAPLRWGLGLSISPYDRARSLFYAQRYGGRS